MYQLRCKVAEPGTAITPPGSTKPTSSKREYQDWTTAPKSSSPAQSSNDDSGSDIQSDEETREFIPEECLFCNHASKDFDENVSHMRQTHSLVIPFQSSLAVDLNTLIWYLHLVIFGYRECICCGRRRRTVEAIQQHMIGSGHCRFNVTSEISEFYDMPSKDEQDAESSSRPDEHTLRLPSGKLLSHRSYNESTSKSKLREKPQIGVSELGAPSEKDGNRQALTKRDRKEQALTTQFAQLRTKDQMSLTHLSAPQQRSLLATHKKALDQAKRAEKRTRRRVDGVGNKGIIDTKYFKQEVPIYMGG